MVCHLDGIDRRAQSTIVCMDRVVAHRLINAELVTPTSCVQMEFLEPSICAMPNANAVMSAVVHTMNAQTMEIVGDGHTIHRHTASRDITTTILRNPVQWYAEMLTRTNMICASHA